MAAPGKNLSPVHSIVSHQSKPIKIMSSYRDTMEIGKNEILSMDAVLQEPMTPMRRIQPKPQ